MRSTPKVTGLVAAGLLGFGVPLLVTERGGPVFPVIAQNDNLRAAGTVRENSTVVALEIVEGDWEPAGPEGGKERILAFQEVGRGPEIPGPMLRVVEGTPMQVTVTNTLDTTIVVHGLSGRRQAMLDTLVLFPGQTGTASFTADVEGTYYYWGGFPGNSVATRFYEDSQLHGAFIVDPVGTTGPPKDRILVASLWIQTRDSVGQPNFDHELFTINGRPWPRTERFDYTVGDSVHWRIINTSAEPHPFHLHGFYFRLDALGDMARDTVYWESQRTMAVTQRLVPGATMRLSFSPDRPGGWVFHCHLNWHVSPNAGIGPELRPTREQREHELFMGHLDHPDDHVERGMGGLMMAMQVRPAPGWTPPAESARRQLHLYIQSDSTPTDSLRRYGYVLQEGDAPPSADSVQSPGATIVLRRGEPTSILVHNNTPQPTSVHWHGLEIESPFDGVVGVGGYATSPAPAIRSGGTFEVRVTPPRSGSFMYHTHINDLIQQSRGLWGALLVLEPDESWDPARDLIFQIGEGVDFTPILNGRNEHPVQELRTGTDYRFRLMNISMGGPGLEFWLVRGGAPIRWTPLARDGYDLPQRQRTRGEARTTVSIGETRDMQVRFPRPGSYSLEVRRANGSLLTSQPITVQPPPGG